MNEEIYIHRRTFLRNSAYKYHTATEGISYARPLLRVKNVIKNLSAAFPI